METLARLTLELWAGSTYEEELLQYKEVLDSPDRIAYLAREEDHPAGLIVMSLRTDYVEGTRTSPVAYLEGIYVRPEYRHQGIGMELLNAGEAWGRNKGCTELGSDAEWMNEASIDFHQTAGFTEVNRIVCFRKDL